MVEKIPANFASLCFFLKNITEKNKKYISNTEEKITGITLIGIILKKVARFIPIINNINTTMPKTKIFSSFLVHFIPDHFNFISPTFINL